MPPASPLAAALPSRGGKPPRARSPSPPGPSHPLPAPLRRRGGRGRPFLLPSASLAPAAAAGEETRRMPSRLQAVTIPGPALQSGPRARPAPGAGAAQWRSAAPPPPAAPARARRPAAGGAPSRWPPGTPRSLAEAAESPRTVSLGGGKRAPETSAGF